jgi:hypothetical protein
MLTTVRNLTIILRGDKTDSKLLHIELPIKML